MKFRWKRNKDNNADYEWNLRDEYLPKFILCGVLFLAQLAAYIGHWGYGHRALDYSGNVPAIFYNLGFNFVAIIGLWIFIPTLFHFIKDKKSK